MGNYFTMLLFHIVAFIQRATERGGSRVKRVHSQLLTPEAPEGKFDQLSVNQLLLYGTVTCLGCWREWVRVGQLTGERSPRIMSHTQLTSYTMSAELFMTTNLFVRVKKKVQACSIEKNSVFIHLKIKNGRLSITHTLCGMHGDRNWTWIVTLFKFSFVHKLNTVRTPEKAISPGVTSI